MSVLLFCTLLFYGIQIAGNRYVWVAHLQVLTVLPLIGIIYYFYRLANTEIMQRFFQGRCWNFMGMTIGGLCLEIYLVQMPILTGEERCLPFGGNTDDLLPLFPLWGKDRTNVCRCLKTGCM